MHASVRGPLVGAYVVAYHIFTRTDVYFCKYIYMCVCAGFLVRGCEKRHMKSITRGAPTHCAHSLYDGDAERPYVSGEVRRGAHNDLRGHPVRGADQPRGQRGLTGLDALADPEVGQLHLALVGD